jgi:CubicO group peptidase (beta-lactamase class C family)
MQVDAKAAGMNAKSLENITRHLKKWYIDPKKISGCRTLVARRGHVAYLESQGLMDIERNKPVQGDTIFRIYSMSKPITSVALMMLYEKGYFQLADPVHKFIPEWRHLQVYAGGAAPDFETKKPDRPMTIRDLMTHMSGLTYGNDPKHPVDVAYQEQGISGREEGATLESMVKKMADLPLKFSPGTGWHYSLSTDVLGYLVEVMSGMSFDKYLQENIFDPLGMEDTGFQIPESKRERFAANYTRMPDKTLKLEDDPADSRYLKAPTFLSGGGGLVSTTTDYYRFCQMLVNGGTLDDIRILGPRTLNLMTLNHLPDNQDLTRLAIGAFSETANEGIGFGLGFAVCLGEVASQSISASDYYWGGAASTIFWVDPIEEIIVIFMTQLMPSATFDFRGQLKSMVYPAIVA